MEIVVVVERDASEPTLWRYGKADEARQLSGDVRRLRCDPTNAGDEHPDPPGRHFPTAVLLARQADPGQDRIAYDLGAEMFPVGHVEQPLPSSPRRWSRSTSGKAKAPGQTLAQRAEGIAPRTGPNL